MIQIKNVVKDYLLGDNAVHALKDVSINFREKEFVSILGPSGCGKTTLLNILGGLDRYTSGDLIVDKISTKQYKDKDWDTYRNHYVGFVFQNYNLIMHLSVLENVELALSIAGMSKKEKRHKAIEALEKVGLSDQLKKKPNQLSGGQMQRVAIARAIVNNPKIILADEPTGALDSETSVQIMEILKELSKSHLIIMVTHNQILAKEYSTRTIELLDGKIICDSNPLKNSKVLKYEKSKNKQSSMKFTTAFSLSIKNLFTKKAKTILTSFAGSIGIIGIALVLAVNSGFTNYINQLQSDALGGYPIAVSTVTVDYGAVSNFMNDRTKTTSEFPTDNKINIYDLTEVIGKLGHYNYISDNFVDYVNDFASEDATKAEDKKLLNSIEYSYATQLNILTKKNNATFKANTSLTTSSIYGTTSSLFFEGLENTDFVLENYEMLQGDYPTNKNQVVLVIPSNNAFSKQTLDDLGIDYTTSESGFEALDFSDIVGKEYKLVLNNDYYSPVYEDSTLTGFTTNEVNDALYDNANNITLTVSGVMRVKEDVNASLFDSGIMYLPELTEYYKNDCKTSTIAVKSRENNYFYIPFIVDVSELKTFLGDDSSFSFTTPTQIKTFVKVQYNVEMTLDDATDLGLQSIGASDIPTGIYFYPKTFDAKDEIIKLIDNWNTSSDGEFNKIVYTDSTGFLSETLGQLIDIISYVLIAFAGISLVVSSIMIGIITYTSVVERTKEIGVLRSIGARKKDISRVFNAETIIIGLLAGTIGICLSYLLTIPINAIIHSFAGDAIKTNIATLEPLKALILIAISIVLTFIAGLIPSKIAAKKDPVKALRTE